MIITRQSTHLQIFLEVTGNHWDKDVHKKKKKEKEKLSTKEKLLLFPRYWPSEGFFRSGGWAMWPTMLIYIAAQILRTFYFSFPLLRHGPPSYSFSCCFIFSLHFVCCDCSLTENNLHFLISITETQTI